MAAGLLDVNVLAGFDAGDGHGGMPVIGRGDGDSVNIFALEQLAEVAFGVRGVTEFLLRLGAEFFHEVALDVADVADVGGFAVGGEGGQMGIGAAVQTDDGKVEAVVGAEDLRITFRCGADGEPSGADRHGVQKFATSDHAFSVWKGT